MAKKARSGTTPGDRSVDTALLDNRDGGGTALEDADLEDREEQSPASPSLRQAREEDDDAAPARLPFAGEGPDDLRSRIAERLARTSRGLAPLDEDGNEEQPDEDEEEDSPITGRIVKPGETSQEEEPEEDSGPAQAPKPKRYIDIPDDGVVRLTVRGETVEMTGADFKANAQKLTAADSYFSEAKNLIEEARRLRSDDSQAQPAATDQSQRSEPDPRAPTQRQWDRGKLAEILDKWQTSDPQEGVDDLIALLDEAGQGSGIDQATVISAATQVYQAEALTAAVEDEKRRAVGVYQTPDFKPLREYPSAMMRQQIPRMVWENTLAQAALGLRAIGIPDEELLRPGITPDEVIRGYVYFQRQPQYAAKIPPLPELTRHVATTILHELVPGSKRQTNGSQEKAPGNPPAENVVRLTETRVERKRALPNTQPRSTSVRTDASKPARRRLSTSETIEKIRQEREGAPVPIAR